MAYLLDTSILAPLANSADAQHAIAESHFRPGRIGYPYYSLGEPTANSAISDIGQTDLQRANCFQAIIKSFRCSPFYTKPLIVSAVLLPKRSVSRPVRWARATKRLASGVLSLESWAT